MRSIKPVYGIWLRGSFHFCDCCVHSPEIEMEDDWCVAFYEMGLGLTRLFYYLRIHIFPWFGRQMRRFDFDSVVKYGTINVFVNNSGTVYMLLVLHYHHHQPWCLLYYIEFCLAKDEMTVQNSEKPCLRQLMTDIRDIIWEKLNIQLKAWLRIKFGQYPKVSL